MINESFLNMKCCKRRSYFQYVKFNYVPGNMPYYLDGTHSERGIVVENLFTANRAIYFGVMVVCGGFIYQAFHFSRMKHNRSNSRY